MQAKGDPLECGNSRGIKLLEHRMKMFEKILELRLRKLITVNNMQFGFSPEEDTTYAVFIIQQLQEKHLEMHKGLFFTFVDLERTYDRVPRYLKYWCMESGPREASEASRSNIPWSINSSENNAWRTDQFPIKVGLHQGSGLSPLLFIVVLDVISEEVMCR